MKGRCLGTGDSLRGRPARKKPRPLGGEPGHYAPFYTVPIECTERDAPYVLDGLLYNESVVDPQEHYTDTHGYIELNFAAFPMFGKRFCPRIRGLHRQWIYCLDRQKDYGALDPIVKSP